MAVEWRGRKGGESGKEREGERLNGGEGERRRECGAREGNGGWGRGGRVNRKEERKNGEGRRCQMVPWDPLLSASLPTFVVKKVGIVLLVHKPQCPGEGLVRGPGNPLMWTEQSRCSGTVLE